MTTPVDAPPPWLYLVTDRQRLCRAAGAMSADADDLLVEQARAAADSLVSHFQIREPALEVAPLLALTQRVRAVAGARMRVLINDRVDVAIAAQVDVHLRASSLPAARVRAFAPPALWLSRAVHSAADASAAGPVDALVAGTVKASDSKPGLPQPLGLAGLAAVVRASAVPLVAIGGLTADDWPGVRAAGAVGLAAVGWFLPRGGETVDGAVRRASHAWAAAVSGAP